MPPCSENGASEHCNNAQFLYYFRYSRILLQMTVSYGRLKLILDYNPRCVGITAQVKLLDTDGLGGIYKIELIYIQPGKSQPNSSKCPGIRLEYFKRAIHAVRSS